MRNRDLPIAASHCPLSQYLRPALVETGKAAAPARASHRGLTKGGGPAMLMKEINMPISATLLAILACPLCKADVKLTADEKGLKCVSCHRVYPIKDDMPVMIVDEAVVEPGRAVKA